MCGPLPRRLLGPPYLHGRRRHRAIGFAIVRAAVFGAFREVLAVDFERADARRGIPAGEGHAHFNTVTYQGDREILERLGEGAPR